MEPSFGLLVEPPKQRNDSVWILVSILTHVVLLALFTLSLKKKPEAQKDQPIARYVMLLKDNPTFEEAPGPAVDKTPIQAPFSDANRKASTPKPTGDQPSSRPGTGGAFIPSAPPAPASSLQPPGAQVSPPQPHQPNEPGPEPAEAQPASDRIQPYMDRPQTSRAPVSQGADAVDWKSAIKDVGKVASLGGGQGSMGNIGGDEGFAESGPLSFESQWFEWGPYAQILVNRIRTNWYANMPSAIRLGLRGYVVIRFTIHRDGRITDITQLRSSEIPPFDFAARKAIELSSPLPPLPADFPNSEERVTCGFYYNLNPQ